MRKLIWATFFLCGAAFAQGDYPNKPVRLVVGFAAGGISDVLGRAIAIPLSKQLGLEIGYLNQYGFVRHGEDSVDHAASVALSMNF